jgi:hypothetical protein
MEHEEFCIRSSRSDSDWNNLLSTFHALLDQLHRARQQAQEARLSQPPSSAGGPAPSSSLEEELARRLAATFEELRRAKSMRDVLEVVGGRFGRGYEPGVATSRAVGWFWDDAKERISDVLMQVGDPAAGPTRPLQAAAPRALRAVRRAAC